ncbi:hypothetical protein [Clostridium sp. C2-6-12]|uniref:hypothetical protein n=1 Tax=Clostridium sp. C2-6-12 TaxID=2698832 RepID=UPI0013708DE1|nr:hypothetical protein [Clostridium sp. C2-6-12]
MKFYEFNKEYEYYALIAVVENEEYPMDIAIKAYAEEIEGGIEEYNESYEDSTPEEMTEQEALERYKKANIEGCLTEEDKLAEFYKQIDLENKLSISVDDNKYVLLLIDGGLI